MGQFECKYCHSLRGRENNYVIDAEQKVLEVYYQCGTILKITFPEGKYEWFKACRGISSQKLDNSRKLPDN